MPAEYAAEITAWRYCDAQDIADPTTWVRRKVWPVDGRSTPQLCGGRLLVHFGSRLNSLSRSGFALPRRDDPDETGFYSSSSDASGWENWLDFLDRDDLPEWARGQRRARVFTSLGAAESARFTTTFDMNGHIDTAERPLAHTWPPTAATVIIEQGTVQLWGYAEEPCSGRYFSDEALGILDRAGLLRECDLALREVGFSERSWLSRAMFTAVRSIGQPRPSVDIAGDVSGIPHVPYHPW